MFDRVELARIRNPQWRAVKYRVWRPAFLFQVLRGEGIGAGFDTALILIKEPKS